jgi:hypothetical protein
VRGPASEFVAAFLEDVVPRRRAPEHPGEIVQMRRRRH